MHRHGSLNHVYRLVWSHVLNAWVAVAETSRGRGKGSRRKLAAAAAAMTALALGGPALATPTGGQVVAGTASISQQGNSTTIRQSSQQAALNWNSFNVGANESVTFVQPSASALAVNRIFDSNGTQILGRLNANGQVYLINPNGVLFGRGAQVNVGGLVASTLDVDNASLGGSKHAFAGKGSGSVINEGTLRAADGGYVALLGNKVGNQGAISARLGTVALGAGSAATLSFDGARLLQLRIEQSTLNNLAENGGLIRADSGQVLMSAGARDSLLASVVNNTGVIEARSVEQRDGSIVLLGGMSAGTTHVAGTLDASAPNGGNGGFIETSAAHVKVANDVRISTAAAQGRAGTWLIDPVDFTIAASGGDISGAALSANLRNGNVVIQSTQGSAGTAGDVHVNDKVNWSANRLTLNAQRNININATLNGSGTASLALEYGQAAAAAGNTAVYQLGSGAQVHLPAGQNFSTTLGADGVRTDYTVITALGAYRSVTGTDLQGINGKLNGNFVLGADIDASATASAAWNPVWWDAGFMPLGRDTGFSGIFDGLGHSINQLSMMSGSGGGSGLFSITTKDALIQNVGLNGGHIKTHYYAGGLVGDNKGTIRNSYAALDVTADGFISGGLVARNSGSIINSYASGAVSGNSLSGGLAGINLGTISNSYATGSVAGKSDIGGLIGTNSGSVDTSFATGRLLIADGGSNFGGLIGSNGAPQKIINSFWSIDGTGQATSKGGTGLTDAQMRTASSFTGFNFTTTPGAPGNNWVLVNVDGGLNNAGGAAGATYPMLASEYATTIHNAHQLQLMAMAPGAAYVLGANIDASGTAGGKGVWGETGFIPVGTRDNAFTGSLDGQGHTISGLYIDLPDTRNVGLIGYSEAGSVIRHVGMLGGSIKGEDSVGGLVGSNGGLVSDSYATGTVSGDDYVGGLVGENGGRVTDSYATGTVSGDDSIGGLMGLNYKGTVNDSHASGNVSGSGRIGGLIGEIDHGTVSGSYASGTVVGVDNRVGGLVGDNYKGTITGSYATGNASGFRNVGGLVGSNTGDDGISATVRGSYATGNATAVKDNAGGLVGYNLEGSIADSYATGVASGDYDVGGLLGFNSNPGDSVSNSYATGAVHGNATTGALVGNNFGIVRDSFWRGAATAPGIAGNEGTLSNVRGLSDAELRSPSSFAGWDMASAGGSHAVWRIYEGQTAPLLRSFLTALTVNADATSKTYDGRNYSGGLVNARYSLAGAAESGNILYSNNGVYGAMRDAGSYHAIDSYLYSGQQGYDIDLVAGALTINRAVITLDGMRTYDGGNGMAAGQLTMYGLVNGESLFLFGNGSLDNKNVGVDKYLNSASLMLADGQGGRADNYTLEGGQHRATITRATLYVQDAGVANKVYDATNQATLTGTAKVLALGDDQLSLTGGNAHFADKHAGTGKTVTLGGFSLQGADAANYDLVQPGNVTADIAKASVMVTGVGAANKVYDATTGATLTGTAKVLALGDDDLRVAGGTAAFSDKHAGNRKTVTLGGFSLQGADAANYALVQPGTVTADIAKASVMVTGVGAANKVYDATNQATLTGTATVLALGDDDLRVAGGNAHFADKHAGNRKTVTLGGFSLQGADAANYDLVQPGNVTADIAKASVVVTGVGAANKVYDATNQATLTGTAKVLALGDDQLGVTGGNAAFADKHAGNGKKVTVSGFSLQGADAANYALVQPSNVTADIAKASVVVTGVGAANKVYDATNQATLTGTAKVLALGDDQLGVTGGNAAFADKHAGNGKKVTVSGFSLQGADAANYDLVQPGNVTADIAKASVVVTGVGAANKVYDATTAATLTGTARVQALGDDDLRVAGGTAAFADKHAGNRKTVLVGGYTLQGADAANYDLMQPGNITADIAKASLLYTAAPVTLTGGRTPDGLSGKVSGLLGSDTLADATSGILAWTSPATASSPAGNYAITASGLSSTDYAFVQAGGNASALTLQSATLPPPAQAAVVQLQAQVLGSFADTRPGTLAAAPTITITQTDAPAANAGASNTLPNTTMQIGSRGPALQVVLGGVKLPPNMLNVNQ
ncbi:filamentous hemagglutinin N-terminal domain-containing protein [Janthinobacterium sp. FW305-129]|uniref:YDG domain-containing protein n=1 Tax=Janthinobacterium sp. FW305-129 TaxID=2775054 RepID=UPI001E59AC35|nr:YDG domain-containing protein [Janthinobacterium sp. FW305-129]MCC7598538.1 filamentous hemagglutinin N-terminal domain-containing protein [Janthinobacterium sp. FW305-129]